MNVVLFDIDGTLIRTGGAGRDALDAALLAEFGKVGSDAVEVNGRTDRGIAGCLFRYHGIEDSDANWFRFRAAYLDVLPRALAARQGNVLDGVVDLVTRLRRIDRTLVGLLTGNVREGARIKLAHYAIDEHFAFGGFGDEHHERDDVAREAFREARTRVGASLRADRIWVVGDTPNDIGCARAIGARVVAVGTGSYSPAELATHEPDLVVADLSDAEFLANRFTEA
ncbi:MAG: HAD family hydrolase [Planctomycetes bacterium]|nr:HAD family hydrolase [Planctomycetota bacterium]